VTFSPEYMCSYLIVKLCVLLTVHVDILCKKNQPDALFIFNLFRQLSSTYFGHVYYHNRELSTVYVQQLARVTRLG
jgi:hypothetical protein